MQQSIQRHRSTLVPGPKHQDGLPSVTLEITRGRARNVFRQLTRTTYFIGAGEECDLMLNDPQFAEVHAYLVLSPCNVSIRHMGFDPPLKVNGRSVRRAILTDQAIISAGPYEFRVHIEAPVLAAANDSAAVHVQQLLDEIAQNKLPGPPVPRIYVSADDNLDIGLENADPVSVGLPASPATPAWNHFSWTK